MDIFEDTFERLRSISRPSGSRRQSSWIGSFAPPRARIRAAAGWRIKTHLRSPWRCLDGRHSRPSISAAEHRASSRHAATRGKLPSIKCHSRRTSWERAWCAVAVNATPIGKSNVYELGRLRELAAWYREGAERTLNPVMRAYRIHTADELEQRVERIERADSVRRPLVH